MSEEVTHPDVVQCEIKTFHDLETLEEPYTTVIVCNCKVIWPINKKRGSAQPLNTFHLAKIDGARIIRVTPVEKYKLRS